MLDAKNNASNKGRNQSGLRHHNKCKILSLIQQKGALPKGEIAKNTGLSAQAATIIINQLSDDGLLRKESPQKGKIGQPRIPYSLNPDGAFSFGLTIGRTAFCLTVEDLCGNTRGVLNEQCEYPTTKQMLSFLKRGITSLETSIGSSADKIVGIGIATPFELWSWAEEIGAPKDEMMEWVDFDFKNTIAEFSKQPIYLCNDGTAASIAELSYGNKGQYKNFLYLYVDEFVGGGVILNKSPIIGSRGNAGAIGSIPIPVTTDNGDIKISQLANSSPLSSLLKSLSNDETNKNLDLDDLWAIKHQCLINWIEQTAYDLCYASVSATSLFDFEAIIIDGSIPLSITEKIVATMNQKIHDFDLRGLSSFDIKKGQIGATAQSKGSAQLPLLATFFDTDDRLRKTFIG